MNGGGWIDFRRCVVLFETRILTGIHSDLVHLKRLKPVKYCLNYLCCFLPPSSRSMRDIQTK
jgi:hypothetical protein